MEKSDDGRQYKVRWQGYPGQDSWEREFNVAGWGESCSRRILAYTWRADVTMSYICIHLILKFRKELNP